MRTKPSCSVAGQGPGITQPVGTSGANIVTGSRRTAFLHGPVKVTTSLTRRHAYDNLWPEVTSSVTGHRRRCRGFTKDDQNGTLKMITQGLPEQRRVTAMVIIS